MLDTAQPASVLAEAFRLEVIAGLQGRPKQLSSRWLYDDAGSLLFERITGLQDYYPTRTETAILRRHADTMASFIGGQAVLIEYGAGACIKTQILLDALRQPAAYVPIDISGDFLAQTAERLRGRYPQLDVQPVVADFTEDFRFTARLPEGRRIAFFPGSTLGNLDQGQALALLRRMRRHVGDDGRALIGVDLIKDTATLVRAYDDCEGVTAEFNLNLLRRINRELRGTLPLEAFQHEARWNPYEMAMEMHLRCTSDVQAEVDGQPVSLQAGETIHTESSRKYDLRRITCLTESAGWRLANFWTDDRRQFAVVGLEVVHRRGA